MAKTSKAKKWEQELEKKWERRAKKWDKKWGKSSGSVGFLWCTGFIGALVYYWSDITSFTSFWVVLFKAIVWPAYLVYELLQFVGA